jgi:hypothetical protein
VRIRQRRQSEGWVRFLSFGEEFRWARGNNPETRAGVKIMFHYYVVDAVVLTFFNFFNYFQSLVASTIVDADSLNFFLKKKISLNDY